MRRGVGRGCAGRALCRGRAAKRKADGCGGVSANGWSDGGPLGGGGRAGLVGVRDGRQATLAGEGWRECIVCSSCRRDAVRVALARWRGLCHSGFALGRLGQTEWATECCSACGSGGARCAGSRRRGAGGWGTPGFGSRAADARRSWERVGAGGRDTRPSCAPSPARAGAGTGTVTGGRGPWLGGLVGRRVEVGGQVLRVRSGSRC